VPQPYLGEIRIFAGNFPPVEWAFCDGQLLSVSEYVTLFNLIGTTYGGDGDSTFALPDLQGRVPIHRTGSGVLSQAYPLGESGGVESVPLTVQQIPSHSHALLASTGGGTTDRARDRVPASSPVTAAYTRDAPTAPLAPTVVDGVGGSQPHDNMGPTVAVNYIISLFGIYPSAT